MRIFFFSSSLIIFIAACSGPVETLNQHNEELNLSTAEAFIDAFYSFNPEELEIFLFAAEESIPSIVFYQGWAQGGNYEIKERLPCIAKESNQVSCSITVQDDLMLALGIDFNVTDTFEISFTDGKLVSVETSSNDLEVFWKAREWVNEKLPELIEEPCQGIWAGGPTPGDCVRAMVEGYTRFAASEDFPEL
jgi:hypothetical protein